MKKKREIKISKIIAPILSSRDAVNVLEKEIRKVNAELVDLDFSDVKFVSRSAAHALLVLKEKLQPNKKIDFTDTRENVKKMLRMVAANRAVPQKEADSDFNPKEVDINSLFKDVDSK